MRGNRYDKQVACSSDLIGPSTVLSRVCYLSGSILRRFDPLTMVSYPRSTCLLVRRFPAHAPHVPLRANRYAQGLFMFVTCAPYRVRPTGRERLGTDSFILSVGCSQPGHLAPERTPFVEARSYVSLNHPSVPCSGSTEFVKWLDAVHRRASRSKTIGEVVKICFPNWLQHHFEQHLNRSVLHGGQTRSTLPHHPPEFQDG